MNDTGKIGIPARDYQGNRAGGNSDLARPPSASSNNEERKIQVPVRAYNQPAPSGQMSNSNLPLQNNNNFQQAPQVIQKGPMASSVPVVNKISNEAIRSKFDEMRQNITAKLQANLKKAEEDYFKQVYYYKEQAEHETKNLLELEKLVLSGQPLVASNNNQGSKAPPQIPARLESNPIPIIKTEFKSQPEVKPASKASSVDNSKLDKEILIAYDNKDCFISNDLNTINPLKTPKDFGKGGGILLLKKKQVLIVYPNGKASVYNIATNQFRNLPLYPLGRSYFTLGFLGNDPAIIGGLYGNTTCCHVSVLRSLNSWIEGPRINVPRSHARCIKHEDSTYLFAGYSGGAITTIEMYNEQWIELSVTMPVKINHFGLCRRSNNIIIFGGEDSSNVCKSVYSFDTSTEVFKKEKNLGESFSCRNEDCIKLVGDKFYILNANENKIIRYNF